MEDILTAHGQLAICSEFRFDIRREDRWHEYITVKRGRGPLSDRWAIAGNEAEYGRFFDGDYWSFELRGADAYFWELEPALVKAKELCEGAQREIEEILERRRSTR